jgi:hypothetical protein
MTVFLPRIRMIKVSDKMLGKETFWKWLTCSNSGLISESVFVLYPIKKNWISVPQLFNLCKVKGQWLPTLSEDGAKLKLPVETMQPLIQCNLDLVTLLVSAKTVPESHNVTKSNNLM